MKFTDFVKRDAGSQWGDVPPATLARLERELKAGKVLSQLVEEHQQLLSSLPVEHIREVTESYRRYQVWRKRASTVARQLESVEREVMTRTTRTHQLALIERARSLCASSRVEALDRPSVVSTSLELWDGARKEARLRARVRCQASQSDHPLIDRYGDYVDRTEDLEGLRSHQWLAMRRGEKDGALSLQLDLEGVPLIEQVTARRVRLGNAAKDRQDESLLQELVLDDLEQALWADLDEWARAEALRFACDAYAGLLQCRPIKTDRLGAVHLGNPKEQAGIAVLDGEGAVLDWLETDPNEGGWMEKIEKLLQDAKVVQLVVPSDTRSSQRLSTLLEKLAPRVESIAVRPAALSDGRKALGKRDRELPRVVASAVVLGKRALNPLKAWGAVDPVRSGVGEYQGEIDEEDLREALAATRAVVRYQAKRAPAAPRVAGGSAKVPGQTVRRAADLRPGMTVSGQVTNVTAFGAFVALGLEYEGMIHISELSDTFVQNPTEVVKIGQQVSAHVLSVDPQRRRISLSLRSEREREQRAPRAAKGPQRSQALRDLEKLFSK